MPVLVHDPSVPVSPRSRAPCLAGRHVSRIVHWDLDLAAANLRAAPLGARILRGSAGGCSQAPPAQLEALLAAEIQS
eukprot:2080863-Pyramimonas_sp.AAC.1